ncbi:putative C6 transcription factor [Calycina marina]|uniref:C6 transcription factor n=1 Tax=Calycina marina TaxID=1763456 RepID=A0A9P8CH93_9HELO|nr:putative C6 transcription factor [Calycina marina]
MSDFNSVPAERPAKRIRQACEPCRRKKSRCPGEQPVCSHCARLKQTCYFAEEPRRRDGSSVPEKRHVSPPTTNSLEERLRTMEAKLAELADQSPMRSISRVSGSATPQLQNISASRYRSQTRSMSRLPPPEVIYSAAETYLLYCDCQPLPLFHRQSFMQTIERRDPELLFAILALTLRFSSDMLLHDFREDDLIEVSRAEVMNKICQGKVELSTLQSLCILSLVDFTKGNTRRASMHSSLGISLAHSAELTSEYQKPVPDGIREERRRCFWSLFLLKRLHGADFGILDFTGQENFPWYPESTGKPTHPDTASQTNLSARNTVDRGIISCEIQLSDIWFKITRYARRRGKPSTLPPWSPQSEYAGIMAQQMELETRMPHVHRFRPAEFSKKSKAELQDNRDYWGPWIFVQFIYHTNLCLLNHPLLLSLRLHNFKSQIPEMFLQSTSDLIASHASWIIHLVGMLEAKAFKVTDPFLAHCVAIVATIILQESFKQDDRNQKTDDFEKCLRFIQRFVEWPHVMRMAEKLLRLRETVSMAYNIDPNRGLLIDLGQFWEILEYASSSETPGSGASLFGATLAVGDRSSMADMAHTSSLPPPTRVDAQEFGMANLSAHQGLVQPYLYSDDELAVLAESFFTQRPEMDNMNGMNDISDMTWWGAGNL